MKKAHYARYERILSGQIERLQNGLLQLPKMIDALERFANGEDVPRSTVHMAIRKILAILTLPALTSPSVKYILDEFHFYTREPIGKLIGSCNARLNQEKRIAD